jgi:carboxyl-terminal processing protease
MTHKTSPILLGATAGAAMILFTLQPHMIFVAASANAAMEDTYRQLKLFGDVFERVRSDYVDRPDDSKLIRSAINGMLTGLDPLDLHGSEGFRDMEAEDSGEFGGLGMEDYYGRRRDQGGDADRRNARREGRYSGQHDLIVRVDDERVQGNTLNQSVEKMRGSANTQVKLTIMRKGHDKPIEVLLTPEVIRVRSVRAKVDGDDVGYIRMTQFTEQTTEELKKAIADITARFSNAKLKGYVLDLRNNPGGLRDEAISVSSAFIQRGEIVSTRGRNPDETQSFTAKGGDLTKGKPLIVLINGGSASASEIVAGALQDQKRATILGTRSFGKGSVQTIIPLGSDNGALQLTTARYYTLYGHSIQAKGILPDIKELQNLPDDIKADTSTEGEASLRGNLKGDADIEQGGSQSYIPPDEKNDKALTMAEELLRGTQMNSAFPPNVKDLSSPN